jgi:glycosyl-4,4'-diaponeurosporenoate acyltransferase
MRIFYFGNLFTLLLCFSLWGILQLGAALFCLSLPDRLFSPDRLFCRPFRWENNGEVYETLLHVKSWKHLLPDGAAAWRKRGYRKRSLTDFSEENLQRFLIESARGELSHWLAIAPFWLFGFFAPFYVVWIMLAYALAVNFPCIVAQRYNRPRIQALLARKYPRGLSRAAGPR